MTASKLHLNSGKIIFEACDASKTKTRAVHSKQPQNHKRATTSLFNMSKDRIMNMLLQKESKTTTTSTPSTAASPSLLLPSTTMVSLSALQALRKQLRKTSAAVIPWTQRLSPPRRLLGEGMVRSRKFHAFDGLLLEAWAGGPATTKAS